MFSGSLPSSIGIASGSEIGTKYLNETNDSSRLSGHSCTNLDCWNDQRTRERREQSLPGSRAKLKILLNRPRLRSSGRAAGAFPREVVGYQSLPTLPPLLSTLGHARLLNQPERPSSTPLGLGFRHKFCAPTLCPPSQTLLDRVTFAKSTLGRRFGKHSTLYLGRI